MGVIGVPAYFSDVHRQAVLDAARIAGISVLRLMNEHTATALAYGIYRSNDFDPEKPMTVAFCSMGNTIFSVSIVQFVKGRLSVLGEKSDKVGGRDMDECLMREFAAQFKKKVGCDPLSNKKAAFKLEDAVVKTKKILSANSEATMSVECLMEDEDFGSNISRDVFLEMCKPMMGKVNAVLEAVKASVGIPVDQIDSVELVGGASRVPWVKEMCSKAFGNKDLSTTMNADESVARGCALMAAILSPLYKVRDFKVEDPIFSPVNIGWHVSATESEQAAKGEDDGDVQMTGADGDVQMTGAEGEYKTATVFPAGSMMGTVKLLTFWRQAPFEIKAEYADYSTLLPGTQKAIGSYKIDLPPQLEPKKVKVKAKLTLHGTFTIENAQLVEIEEYEETLKEKREIPPSPEETKVTESDPSPTEKAPAPEATESDPAPKQKAPSPEAEQAAEESPKPQDKEDEAAKADEEPAEGEAKKEEEEEQPKKEPEKRYEWVDVVKKKKRTKRTDIPVIASGRLGLGDVELQKRMDGESAMQAEMAEIIETDDRRNDLESYIFNMRDKTSESGEYGQFIAVADREKFHSELTKTEDWLYDAYDATKVVFIDKLNELKTTGDPVVWRYKESQIRDEWIQALSGTISNYKCAAENPGDKYVHIAVDKLAKIVAQCDSTTQWLNDLQAKQATLQKYERPVLICADMEKKNQKLAKFADDILKEPKPAPPEPPKDEKKEEPQKEEEEAAAGKEENGMEVDSGEEKKEPSATEATSMDVD